jgi:hypothetical protein
MLTMRGNSWAAKTIPRMCCRERQLRQLTSELNSIAVIYRENTLLVRVSCPFIQCLTWVWQSASAGITLCALSSQCKIIHHIVSNLILVPIKYSTPYFF